MVMDLIRATSPLKGRFFVGSYKFSLTRTRYLHATATFSLLPGLDLLRRPWVSVTGVIRLLPFPL
jgi:hypothetical protein